MIIYHELGAQRSVRPRHKYLDDTSSCYGVLFECKYGHESEALPWLRIVRAVLELPWREVTGFAAFRDRFCSPPVTGFVGTGTKTLPRGAFFSCCFLRRFWGRKRREKRREKVRGAKCSAISWIQHLRSCRMQISVANLLLHYNCIISLKSSCPATSFAFEQESRLLVFWMHPRRS